MSVTMKEIAAMANVSQAAVSIAINKKKSTRVSEQKREEILALAKKLDYSPSISARHLRGKGTNTIGIIGGVCGVSIQSGLIWRISTLLRERGYHSMLVDSSLSKEEEREIINEFVARGVDAIIIASFCNVATTPPVPHLRIDTGEKTSDIGIDKEYGEYKITRHLIREHGHRNIAFLTFTPEGTQYRYKGYKKALQEAGIEVSPELFICTRNNINAEKQVLDLVKTERATAFCCSNDYLAAHLITFLQRSGVNVPNDVAVTGFDGLRLTEFINPAITTVIQPMFELADKSVEMLMQKLEKNSLPSKKELLRPSLHIAESCGCVNKSAFVPFADFRTMETIEGCTEYSKEERAREDS